MTATRKVVEVLPSAHFHPVAEVLVTECGHRHSRPRGMVALGESIVCPMCEDDAEGNE